MANPFKAGDRVTVIHIDGCLAMTHRAEVQVKEALPEPEIRNGRPLYGSMTYRGKRKLYHLGGSGSHIFLRGWDLPLRVDTDQHAGTMHGNACFNFTGNPDGADNLRQLLTEQAVIPITDEARSKCLLWTLEANGQVDTDAEPAELWPETKTDHAAIQRIRAAANG